MPGATVTVLTEAGGAHLGEYLQALAATEEVESVIVADPSGASGASEAAAKQTLGAKLKAFERDHAKGLADHHANLALVTEARTAGSSSNRTAASRCSGTARRKSPRR